MADILFFVILFVYGFAVILMGCVALKNKKPKNKVHFYVTCEVTEYGDIIRTLWLGKPYCTKEKNNWRTLGYIYGHAGCGFSYGVLGKWFSTLSEGTHTGSCF